MWRTKDRDQVEMPVPVALPPEARERTGRVEAQHVLAALDATASLLTQSIIPASKAVDVLLDLWSTVHRVDAASAVPLEELMTSLVRRSFTTPQELTEAIERTRTLIGTPD